MVMLTDNSYKVLNYGSKKIKKTILKFLGKKKKEDKPTPTYVKKAGLQVTPGNITKGQTGLYKPNKIGDNSPNYATKSKDPNRGNKVPGIHSSEYLTTTPRPKFKTKDQGQRGNVRQITEDTKYGGMQEIKKMKTGPKGKNDNKDKKVRYRAGPTMTGFGSKRNAGVRKSGMLKGKYIPRSK
tara:strand:+ start:96 stop:641 length:546 start_codon:yes stop_codon:yes gene_type:complete